MISDYFRLLRQSPKILALGFSFAFFSSFGQTFFISLSVPSITERFGFSNTEWGTLYSGVNVLSALCLPFLGAKLDKTPLRNYARNVALGLGLACGLMAVASNYLLLGLAIFGLRLTGQGLLSLMSTATMARLFHEQRGKALSIATMGFPVGETLFPAITILFIAKFGWRPTWGMAAVISIAILYPLTRFLIDTKTASPSKSESHVKAEAASWNRRQVLGHWQFYTLIPTYVSPGFLATGLVLYQFSLADEKGWSHTLMASSFISFGLSRLLFAFLIGPLIDRFGAQRLFTIQIAPLALGMLLMAFSDHTIIPFLYNGLMGISLGIGSSTSSALWAELYGPKHLGAIKSLMSTIGIFATSLSPILVGSLLDLNIGFATQMKFYAAILLAIALLSKIGCWQISHTTPRS
jgi:MFS family permease